MTISSTDNKVVYVGDSVITSFSYTYRVSDDSWMEVYLGDVLQANTEYTILRAADDEGGTVTFNTAPLVDIRVTLIRILPLTQGTDYQPYDAFPAETHEDALDELTMIAQQLSETTSRTLVAGIGTPIDVSYVMPVPEGDKVLVWATDAKSLTNGPSIGTFQEWATSAESAADESAASAASAANSAIQAEAANLHWVGGDYSPATTYAINDAISYNGSSFRAVQITTGNEPTHGTYWHVVAAKGEPGAGTGDMLAANNLSEVTAATAVGNLGLANVDNTADANKPVSTPQQTALDLKADLVSPALTGTPTTPTPAGNDVTTKIATTTFVRNAISTYTPAPTIPTAYEAIGTYATATDQTSRTVGVIYTGTSIGLTGNQWRCMGHISTAGSTVMYYTYLYVRVS